MNPVHSFFSLTRLALWDSPAPSFFPPRRFLARPQRTRVSQAFRSRFTTFLFVSLFFQTLVVFAASAVTDQDVVQIPPDEGSGFAMADRRHEFPPTLIPRLGKRVVPNLAELRRTYLKERGFEELAVPGGIGSGTLYKLSELHASFESELLTWMIVHPEGMDLPANWIFTTATNRTEKTVEVVGTYFGIDPGHLGIFDWSCLSEYPCPNGSPGPSWQWALPLSSLSCYYQQCNAGGGHRHHVLSQANQSEQLGDADPPLWRNSVWLQNVCTRAWDLVYTHEFRVHQKDCTLDNSCGWWGPIIETFFENPQPPINALGFWKTTLFHDGLQSKLRPDETDWVSPAPPWQTYFLQPNHSWIVGP